MKRCQSDLDALNQRARKISGRIRQLRTIIAKHDKAILAKNQLFKPELIESIRSQAQYVRLGSKVHLRGNRCLGGVLISGEDRAGRSAADYRRSVASIDAA
jgi:hypothetical protein